MTGISVLFWILSIQIIYFPKTESVCENGTFGENCENSCGDNCQTCVAEEEKTICETCEKGYFWLRGICIKCLDKCSACNYITPCNECIPGYYGQQCLQECPVNCLECTSAVNCTKCKDGWSGVMCQCSYNCLREGDIDTWCSANGTCTKGCVNGKFGEKCNVDCPRKDSCIECHQESGKCNKCADGLFGRYSHCDKACGNCSPDASNAVVCSIDDGICIGNCSEGYYGEYCKQICRENCFDPSVKLKKCNKTTGICESCKAGNYGNFCEQKCGMNCESGCDRNTGICYQCKGDLYGIGCNMTCPQNCGSISPNISLKHICQRTSGECLRCIPGFEGAFCEKKAKPNDSDSVFVLTGVLAAVTVAFMATLVGLVYQCRRGNAGSKMQNPDPAVYYYSKAGIASAGSIGSPTRQNLPQQSEMYEDIKANMRTETVYSLLETGDDVHIHTQSA